MAKKRTKKYTVIVTRISYASRNIEVEASNKKETKELALEDAGNHEFSEHDADYKCDLVIPSEDLKPLS